MANLFKWGGVVAENGPVLISFVIGTETYQAEEGMTFEQWVSSEYNTAGFVIYNTYYITTADAVNIVVDQYTGMWVMTQDVIVDGREYWLHDLAEYG